jgi:hypothetical protein
MITIEQIERARENWIKASLSLRFRLVTPYFVDVNGIKKEVFAFLPEYGSSNGVIICLTSAPDFETDRDIINWAKENKFFYSFINIESCQKYDEDYFRDALEDWVKY